MLKTTVQKKKDRLFIFYPSYTCVKKLETNLRNRREVVHYEGHKNSDTVDRAIFLITVQVDDRR